MQAGKVKTNLKPKLWTLNFILVCLSSVTMYIAFHSLVATLPVYISTFGGSAQTAGLALGVLTVAAVIIRPFSGLALDLYGRKFIFIGGLILFLIPNLFYVSLVPVTALLILRFIQGLGWGICNTAAGTVASDVVPKSRLGEGLGLFSLTTSFSLAVAPAIGLWVIDKFSFQTLFIVCSALSLMSIILALLVKYPSLPKEHKPKVTFLERSALRPAVVAMLAAVTYSSVLSFLALFVRQKGLATAGIFFTTLAATTVVSRPLAGKLADNMGKRGYDYAMLLGIPSLGLAMLILSLTAGPIYLVAGGIVYGIGFGLVQSAMLALCVYSAPGNRRGAANATYWTAFDIGIAGGSIVWGLVANLVGYPIMFVLNVVPAVLALGVYFLRNKEKSFTNAE